MSSHDDVYSASLEGPLTYGASFPDIPVGLIYRLCFASGFICFYSRRASPRSLHRGDAFNILLQKISFIFTAIEKLMAEWQPSMAIAAAAHGRPHYQGDRGMMRRALPRRAREIEYHYYYSLSRQVPVPRHAAYVRTVDRLTLDGTLIYVLDDDFRLRPKRRLASIFPASPGPMILFPASFSLIAFRPSSTHLRSILPLYILATPQCHRIPRLPPPSKGHAHFSPVSSPHSFHSLNFTEAPEMHGSYFTATAGLFATYFSFS